MTAHPDKGGSEAKMAAVNEAYEVLSNPGPYLIACLDVINVSHPFDQSCASALTMARTQMTRWHSKAVILLPVVLSQGAIHLLNFSSKPVVVGLVSNSTFPTADIERY
jgi:hypothetical protein